MMLPLKVGMRHTQARPVKAPRLVPLNILASKLGPFIKCAWISMSDSKHEIMGWIKAITGLIYRHIQPIQTNKY